MRTLIHTIIYPLLLVSLLVSCADFLSTAPMDQLSPATFWKTEKDAYSAAVACYYDWADDTDILFADCMSDIGYNYSGSGSYKYVGNGSLSSSSTISYYSYTLIRRCNTFLEKAKEIPFDNEADKKDLFAQVRTIRAYRYFLMNFWYGGVPIVQGLPETADDAKLPRNAEAEVKKYVYDELDAAILDLKKEPAQVGRIARGAALALKMRAALYWGDFNLALNAAKQINDLNIYRLHHNFSELFSLNGKASREIIYAMQRVETTYKFTNTIRLYNNQDGGWASMTPTQNLVEMYEMKSGLLPEEEGSLYNPVHPFANRDPRLAMSILYPGMDWVGTDGKMRVINTLDKKIDGKSNQDHYSAANNSSKTGLTWAKYTYPRSQYATLDNTGMCVILFRYAEVLLTIAEANVELNQNFEDVYAALDEIRIRAGHVKVDRSKYNTQAKLRELVRRERCIELAGEGLRRADIVRWKDAAGKMIAETVLNGILTRVIGTVKSTEPNPEKRAIITLPTNANLAERKIEDRVFQAYNRYLPLKQSELDRNPNLTQTPGYE